MSTLEHTISMMENLPEADLLEIQNFIREIFRRHAFEEGDEKFRELFKPMSREAFIKDIELAKQEIADGKYSSAEEVFGEWERRYSL